MRRVFTTAAIVLLATGCATPRGYEPREAWSPLQAYIVSPERDLTFHVSRPAYVAMFEISPGEYTRLMYPTRGHGRTDGFVHGGDRVWRGGGFMRSEVAFASHRGGWARPRFIFLIASDEPLRLDAFGPGGHSIQHAMGFRSYASADPYHAMERLVDIALPPMVSDVEWTTDFYVYWPQVFEPRRASRRVLVECYGYSAWVPIEVEDLVWREICGSRQAYAAPSTPGGGDDDGKDGEIVQPGRRAPIPREGDGSRAFRPSSRQLQQPIDTRPERRAVEGERITAGDGEDGRTTDGIERPERGRAGVTDAERGDSPGTAGTPAGRGGAVRDPSRPARATPAEPGAHPGGHAEPVNRAAPALPEARARPADPVATEPGTRAEPAEPTPRPEPAQPAPRSEPRTVPVQAAPSPEPQPAARPEPKPAVEPRPAQEARPAPRPAPEPRPAPQQRVPTPRVDPPASVDPPARVDPPTRATESARPATRSQPPAQPVAPAERGARASEGNS